MELPSFSPESKFRRTRHRTTTLEAQAMHEMVSPARWCVTYSDLQFLRREVAAGIKDGSITADAQEAKFGPSIYKVNEMYIKPVTFLAGKMSWALMMNPKGLDSDLFITHAWQEGIFEFIGKVLVSWPVRARHAWCCMLANPQNLDIAALLHSPCSSPFAIALQSSKYMLVVPNRHRSVYTRLWCGYEAYLAFESKKIIRTARRSIFQEVLRAWAFMLPTICLAICLSAIWHNLALRSTDLVIMAFICSLVSENFGQWACLAANHLGLLGCTILLMVWMPAPDWMRFQGLPAEQAVLIQRTVWGTGVFFFLMAEVDRLNYHAKDLEGQELRQHYKGSLRSATCSQAIDEAHIRAEIGDKVDQVDDIIEVLISAGMTSPALRQAQDKGVNINHAGDAQYSIPATFLGPQLVFGIYQLLQYLHHSGYDLRDDGILRCVQLTLHAMSVLARLGFLVVLCRRPIDERCFMLKVMTKLVSALLVPSLASILLGAGHELTMKITFIAFHLSFCLVLVFACLGIRGTLTLPGGVYITQFFLRRFLCSFRPRKEDIESDEETSDSE